MLFDNNDKLEKVIVFGLGKWKSQQKIQQTKKYRQIEFQNQMNKPQFCM